MHPDSTPVVDGCAFIRIGEQVTLVDREVAEGLSGREFRITSGYAQMLTSSGRWVKLSRLIVKPPRGMFVDHINGVTLDNRRENLRAVTPAENMHNKRKMARPCTSQFKGVHWHVRRAKWIARIHLSGSLQEIGAFDHEEAAARAYDEVAFAAWGDKACLNFGNPVTGATAITANREQSPIPRKRGTRHPGTARAERPFSD